MSIIEKALSKQNAVQQLRQQDIVAEPAVLPASATSEPIVEQHVAPAVQKAQSNANIELDLAMLESNNFVSLSSERRLINEE